MFDRTFYRFAIGFIAIIALSVGLLYLAERFDSTGSTGVRSEIGS